MNGKSIPRSYISYSKSTKSVFCIPCRLYGGTTSFSTTGFCNWWKGEEKLLQHENSKSHKNCVLNLKLRGNVLGRIDSQMVIQLDTEVKYWKDVLIRVVAVVKSLCLRGLSFRGAEYKFGFVHGGNFIMSLELIAEFDDQARTQNFCVGGGA